MKKDRFTRNLHRREAKSRRRRQRKATQAVAAAALAGGAIAMTGGSASGWGDTGGGVDDGLIAFDSLRDQNAVDVWTVDPNNANPPATATARTQSPFYDGQPAFSPNGTQIAFISQRASDPTGPQVYVQDVGDPGTAHPVTNSATNDLTSLLSWSPDGRYIAFNKGAGAGPFGGAARDIYVVDTQTTPDGLGNNERQVTNDLADDANPSWSPNGNYIAFESNREPGQDYDIWRVDAAGTESNPVDIAPYAGSNENEPDYSPGGILILFASDKNQAGNRDVYVKPASTSTTNWRLTTHPLREATPRFSPNLFRFTYSSDRGTVIVPNPEIMVQNLVPDTSSNANVRNVTQSPAPDQHPDWQGVPRTGSGGCFEDNQAAKEDSLIDEALAENTSPLSKILNNQQPSSSSYGGYNAGSSDNAGQVSTDCGDEGGGTSDGGGGSDGGSSD